MGCMRGMMAASAWSDGTSEARDDEPLAKDRCEERLPGGPVFMRLYRRQTDT